MPPNNNRSFSIVVISAVALLAGGAMLVDTLREDEAIKERSTLSVSQAQQVQVPPSSVAARDISRGQTARPAPEPHPGVEAKAKPVRTRARVTGDDPAPEAALRASLHQKLAKPGTYTDERTLVEAFEKATKSVQAAVSVNSTDCGEGLCKLDLREDAPAALADMELATLSGPFSREFILLPGDRPGRYELFVATGEQPLPSLE